MVKRVLFFFLILSCLLPSAVFASDNWDNVVRQIGNDVGQSLEAYRQGDVDKAKDLLGEAYFGPFESDRLEQAIRIDISSKRAAELEFQFNTIRKKMTAGAEAADVQQAAEQLLSMIREDVKTLQDQQSGPMGLLFYSLLIIVREGVEAILIIAAIAAYLVKSGNGHRVKDVYKSALAAVLASLVTAYLFQVLFDVSGVAQEFLEGAVLVLATCILFSMSYWMFSKADAKRWKHFIEGKIRDSIGSGKRFTLWFAVFLAVYREGAETVLFYKALFSESPEGSGAIGTGLGIGALILVVLFYFIRFGSAKLPLKPFFLASGALLYVLAFIFAGEGIKELQASGLVSNNEISGFGTLGFLGIFPSWEGVAAQGLLILLFVAALIHLSVKHKQKQIQANNV